MTRRWLGYAVVVAAGIAVVLWVLLVRVAAPSDGTTLVPGGTGALAWSGAGGVVVREVAGDTPLRPGDRVLALDGVPLATLAARPRTDLRAGATVRYTVERDGRIQEISVRLGPYPLRAVFAGHAATTPFVAVLLVVAAFVIVRRPRDPAARSLLAMGLLLIAGSDAYPYGSQVVDIAAGRVWPTVLSDAANALLWGALLHFAVVFPRPWPFLPRRAVLLAYLLPFLLYAAALATALPGADPLARLARIAALSPPAADVFPFLVAAAMALSYRLAPDRLARRWLRWLLGAFALAATVYIGLGRLPEWLSGRPLVEWDVLSLVFLPFPVALGWAVLRYRLFDVQVLLRRSLVSGLLSLLLLGVYLAVNALSPLLAALVVPAAVPVGALLRHQAGRWVFGDRFDPYEVLRQLGRRLESAGPSEAVLDDVTRTLVRTLRLAAAAIEVDGLPRHAYPDGAFPDPHVVELVHRGEHLGRLILDTGHREPFGADDAALLEGLARQVAVTAHNLLLTARLRRSLGRTISALEEERRRLRRDIHDGLGPTLASATMRLELARELIHTDPATAEQVFAGMIETHHRVLADVRRLIDGLRPPVLDQLGLVPALRERAAHLTGEVAITVEAPDDLTDLPAAAEVAAYHIVSEALTNVVRHAAAGRATVRLWRDGGLHVQVDDDGLGLPPSPRLGVGLSSIRERAVELGGGVTIGPRPSGGTRVEAQLPLPA